MTDEIGPNTRYEAAREELADARARLAAAIEERDHLRFHEKPWYNAKYITEVGVLEYERFQLDCDIARTKLKIELIRAMRNRRIEVTPELVRKADAELDKQLAEYMDRLGKMARDIERARRLDDAVSLSVEEDRELKGLYRGIAKRIHPDIDPAAAERFASLWEQAVDAFGRGDLAELRALSEAVDGRSEWKDGRKESAALEELLGRIERANEGVEKVTGDIRKMREDFPFTVKELLEDPVLLAERKDDLRKGIRERREAMEALRTELLGLLPPDDGNVS
jgi:hypothetical protein